MKIVSISSKRAPGHQLIWRFHLQDDDPWRGRQRDMINPDPAGCAEGGTGKKEILRR